MVTRQVPVSLGVNAVTIVAGGAEKMNVVEKAESYQVRIV